MDGMDQIMGIVETRTPASGLVLREKEHKQNLLNRCELAVEKIFNEQQRRRKLLDDNLLNLTLAGVFTETQAKHIQERLDEVRDQKIDSINKPKKVITDYSSWSIKSTSSGINSQVVDEIIKHFIFAFSVKNKEIRSLCDLIKVSIDIGGDFITNKSQLTPLLFIESDAFNVYCDDFTKSVIENPSEIVKQIKKNEIDTVAMWTSPSGPMVKNSVLKTIAKSNNIP